MTNMISTRGTSKQESDVPRGRVTSRIDPAIDLERGPVDGHDGTHGKDIAGLARILRGSENVVHRWSPASELDVIATPCQDLAVTPDEPKRVR
jgi:hypothetical protein